jgi:hypothetical protein
MARAMGKGRAEQTSRNGRWIVWKGTRGPGGMRTPAQHSQRDHTDQRDGGCEKP